MDIYESPETETKDDHLDDDLAIKPTQTAQTAHHDVVFGEITEDGPNYRNVHKWLCPNTSIQADLFVGWFPRNRDLDDEESDWIRNSLYPNCLQFTWNCSRSHCVVWHRRRHHLV